MNQPELDDTLREPLDDEERELMDPETWDWDSAEVLPPVPASSTITEIHLSREELALVDRAAQAEGMTLAAYLRHAALERALHPV